MLLFVYNLLMFIVPISLIDMSCIFNQNKMSNMLNVNNMEMFFEFILFELMNSVSVDEGHDIMTSYIFFSIIIMTMISFSITSMPFLPASFETDSLQIMSDSFVLCLSISFIFIHFEFFKVFNNNMTWDVPIMFNLFLPLIELAQKMASSMTVSLSMSANLTAGHLLLSLITSIFTFLVVFKKMISSSMMFILMTLIILMELIISLIQIYIISVLLMYYNNDSE